MAGNIAHYLLKYRLAPLCYYLLRVYLSLIRVKVVGEEAALASLSQHGRVVAAIWHQRFLPALAYVTRFRKFKPIVMISRSSDGELIAGVAERLGLVAVRGSSSRGARAAFLAVLRALRKNRALVHIVDGPKGPKGVVKPGLIGIAQVSRAVILPIIVSADRAWIMRSWDRFLVPKPFSKVMIKWGEPCVVPRRLDSNALENLRQDIEERLADSYARADLEAGWDHPL